MKSKLFFSLGAYLVLTVLGIVFLSVYERWWISALLGPTEHFGIVVHGLILHLGSGFKLTGLACAWIAVHLIIWSAGFLLIYLWAIRTRVRFVACLLGIFWFVIFMWNIFLSAVRSI